MAGYAHDIARATVYLLFNYLKNLIHEYIYSKMVICRLCHNIIPYKYFHKADKLYLNFDLGEVPSPSMEENLIEPNGLFQVQENTPSKGCY